jgi:MFS family permease
MTDIERRLTPASDNAAATWRTPVVIIGFGCLIAMMSFGPRSSLGFFLTPLSSANHWGRDVFAFALALQNLLWGVGQPIAGAIADRYGTARVLCAGGLMYATGLALMSHANSAPLLDVSAGVLIGFGLSGCSFMVLLAAFEKLLPPEWRSRAFGFGTAAGSFGQFLYSPVAVALMDQIGWQQTLTIFALTMLAILPLSLGLVTPAAVEGGGAAPQSLRQALGEAFGQRSYLLLVLGFFTCGFQLAFIRRPDAEALSAFDHLFRPRCRDLLLYLVPGDAGHVSGVRCHHGSDVAFDGAANQWHYCRIVRHALAGDARRLCLLQSPGRWLSRRFARRHRVRAHWLV